MNELIEQLWEKLSIIEPESLCSVIDIDGLTEAIQTACKAQINACSREYKHNKIYIGHSVAEKSIETARITKEDYE